MEKLRAEVIWDCLTHTQRIALKQGLFLTETSGDSIYNKTWKELQPRDKSSLLKLDWEVMLGVQFPKMKG